MLFSLSADEKGTLAMTHYVNDENKTTIGLGELLATMLNAKYDKFTRAMKMQQRKKFDRYEGRVDEILSSEERDELGNTFYRLCANHLPHPIDNFYYFLHLDIVYRCKTLEPLIQESEDFSRITKRYADEYEDIVSGKQTEYVTPSYSISTRYEYKNGTFAEFLEIDWFPALIAYCLYQALKNGIKINKCQNCGKYFAPISRSDEIYCDNIFTGDKSCKQVGYERKMNNDEFMKAYRTAYKTQNARKNRNIKNSPNAEADFKKWIIEAKAKLKEAQDGTISLDELKKWLKEG